MPSRALLLLAALLAGSLSESSPPTPGRGHQPRSVALLAPVSFQFLGAFRLPTGRFGTSSFDLAPDNGIAFNPTGNDGKGSLFIASHAADLQVAEVSVPALVGGTTVPAMSAASVIQDFADPSEGRLRLITPAVSRIGGILVDDGRLIVSYYAYYDASGEQVLSHIVRRTLNLSAEGSVSGPFGPGSTFQSASLGRAGYVDGYMAPIPAAWQAKLKGTAITGNGMLSIISRTSFGPGVFSFTPSTLAANFPVQPLAYYPENHTTLGDGARSTPSLYFNLADSAHGVVFDGDRVLVLGSHGQGKWCYGPGVTDQSLDGKPTGEADNKYCYDPANGSKGQHAYPYVPYVWAFDANDLATVAAGKKSPWDVKPSVSVLPAPIGGAVAGAAYDAATRRMYVAFRVADPVGQFILNPLIAVYQIL